MSDHTDYSQDLAHKVMLRLMDLTNEFERAGHDRKHVTAAIRWAMKPAPISDVQLRSYVERHLAMVEQAAQDRGQPATEKEAERVRNDLLDSAANAGVMPSRVVRIFYELP